MSSYWGRYTESMAKAMAGLEITDRESRPLDFDAGFERLGQWVAELRELGGTLHLVGNGASASMASHMAIDWTKNAGVRAVAHNDMAALTAIGNDLGYEHVFAGPIAWYAREGDIVATISSSGSSPNVVKALEAARARGCRLVTLSGMRPDNPSRRMGDLNLFVPALTYGIVECTHQVLLHAWFDRFMKVHEWETTERQTPPPLRAGQ